MRDHWPEFASAVAARLEQGAREYGDRSFDRPPVELVDEVEEEILDTAAWSFILWIRVRRLREAAGYRVTRAAASLGEWDLVGIGSTDVVLVQVKTRDWPGVVEMETLRGFVAPPSARKLVHRWRHRERLPDVREI